MKILNKLAVASVFLVPSVTFAQDTSSSSDIEQLETYGNCTVFDEVDMLTDRVTYTLRCVESTFTDKTEIAFFVRDNGALAVGLNKGVQFYLEDRIEVAVRIDRGELRSGTWRFDSETDYAVSNDLGLFNALLSEVANGERIAMQVGEETGNVRLTGSRDAVMDFVERAGGVIEVEGGHSD